jgi:uncharacterized Zn finger protein
MKNIRRQQGELIDQTKGSIKKLDDKNYVIDCQSGNDSYNIQLTSLGFVCSCPDSKYRGVKCKHIHAIEFSIVAAYHYRQAAESNVYMLMLPLTLLNDSQLCEAITSLKL